MSDSSLKRGGGWTPPRRKLGCWQSFAAWWAAMPTSWSLAIHPGPDADAELAKVSVFARFMPKYWTEETEGEPLTLRQRTWLLFEVPDSSRVAYLIYILLMGTIVLSLVNFIISTMVYVRDTYALPFVRIDYVCAAVLTVEFLLRIASCPSLREFVLSFFNWIDFLALLPTYLDILIVAGIDEKNANRPKSAYTYPPPPPYDPLGPGLPVGSGGANATAATADNVRSGVGQLGGGILTTTPGGGGNIAVLEDFRLFRLVRILKLAKYYSGFHICMVALERSSHAVGMLFFFLSSAIVLYGSIVWYCERYEVDTQFESIPRSMWWAVVTLSTVGYGDMYPTTVPGRWMAALAMFTALLILSLPIGVVGGNFVEVMKEYNEERDRVLAIQLKRMRERWAAGQATHVLEGQPQGPASHPVTAAGENAMPARLSLQGGVQRPSSHPLGTGHPSGANLVFPEAEAHPQAYVAQLQDLQFTGTRITQAGPFVPSSLLGLGLRHVHDAALAAELARMQAEAATFRGEVMAELQALRSSLEPRAWSGAGAGQGADDRRGR